MRWLILAVVAVEIILVLAGHRKPAASRLVAVEAHVSQGPQVAGDDDQPSCRQVEACAEFLHSVARKMAIDAPDIANREPNIIRRRAGGMGQAQVLLPEGYRYCTSMLDVTTIVPFGTDESARLVARSIQEGVSLEIWTPALAADRNSTLVEADIAIIGVHGEIRADDEVRRHCDPIGRTIVDCGMSQDSSGELPVCSTAAGH